MWYAILAYRVGREPVAYHVGTGLSAEEAYADAERWARASLAQETAREVITVVKPY
jgi:hypothetical protein